MLDPNALSDEVLSTLAQRFDIPDEHFDKLFLQIRAMSPEEALNAFLEWHGIINYSEMFLRAWKNIEAATIKPKDTSAENARRFEFIREACGHVQNGSDVVVTICQDDATYDWIVRAGNTSGYGRSLESALDDLTKNLTSIDETEERDRQRRIEARIESSQRRDEYPGDSRDPNWTEE